MKIRPSRQHLGDWKLPFFSVWSGQQLSLIGSSLAQFALVWWLTETTGSATVLATASMVALLPSVLLGPIAGALVDRWDRRRLMLVADGFIALVSAWLVYLFWADAMQIWHVYVIMLARAIGGCFHFPAMQASTSLMVPKEHLSRVAGLNHTMQGALSVASPPLSALLLGILPLHALMALDVITAAFAVGPLLLVHLPCPQRPSTSSLRLCSEQAGQRPAEAASAGQRRPSLWTDVREGLSYVWRWPGMLAALTMATVVNFFLNPVFSLLPILVTRHFGGGPLQLAWTNSAWGVGLVLGGLTLSVWGGFRRRVLTWLMGLIGVGLGVLIVGLAPATALPLALVGMFAAGFMNPISSGPMVALCQAIIPSEMQGRVFTLASSLQLAMAPLSVAIAGPVADTLGVRFWYVMGGVVCTLMAAGGFFIPAVMHVEENHRVQRVVEATGPLANGVPV